MKALFLDIDGVLNRFSTSETIGFGMWSACVGLDKYLLDKFLAWYSGTKDVEIILSSTWRLDEGLVDYLKASGLTFDKVTPNLQTKRGEEILDFLSKSEYQKYAILDDTDEMGKDLKPFFVQTSYVHGLRDKDLKKVERILSD